MYRLGQIHYRCCRAQCKWVRHVSFFAGLFRIDAYYIQQFENRRRQFFEPYICLSGNLKKFKRIFTRLLQCLESVRLCDIGFCADAKSPFATKITMFIACLCLLINEQIP